MNLRGLRSFAAITLAVLGCAGLIMSGSALAKEKAKPKSAPKATKTAPKEPEAAPPAMLPWTLRDHFRFQQGKTLMRYAVETAEWSLELENKEVVVDNAKFQITLADGSTLDATGLGKAASEREKFTNEIGSGTAYVSVFPPKDGLLVRHSVGMFSERPFFLIHVGIGNNSEKPIKIAKITVASFGPGGIAHLSPDTQGSARRLQWRGGCPVFKKDAPSMLSILEDRGQGLTLSFGILPQGVAISSVDLAASGGNWLGDAVCVYDPPIRIDPGQKIESDAVWCTLTVPTPTSIDENYAWSMSLLPHPSSKQVPRGWVTAEKGASQEDMLSAANAWKGLVKEVLVPGTWEGRPGSLEGSAPQYPKDMGKLAKQLEAAGSIPGISVDPLMTSGGGADWTAKSSDGTTWLKLSVPEARKQTVERMKKVVGWGYKFFVVVPSSIPNEVLKQFNVTRAQADAAAVSVMAEAAGGLPVLASSACTLKADVDAWLEAAASENRMAYFGMTAGPVRFEVGSVQSLDANLLTAMMITGGPIELVGTPKGQVGSEIARLLSRNVTGFCPVDASRTAPKLWRSKFQDAGYSLLAFPGARPWRLEDLSLDNQGDVQVWRAADGQFVDAAKGPVTPDNALTVYGITPKPAHPVLMGASTGIDLLLDDMKSLAWDEQKGLLSGAFAGGNTDRATAYVAVPEGWTLESGRVSDQPVSKKGVAGVIQFTVAPGVPTKFELKFSKK